MEMQSFPEKILDESNIHRTARIMIKFYGDAAQQQAVQRANKAAAQRDPQSEIVWREITEAIVELASESRKSPEN